MYGPKLTKKKGSDIVDGSIAAADLAEDTVTGNKAAEVADANTVPGIVVAHRTTVPADSGGDTSITIDDKIRVMMVFAIMKGGGAASDTLQLFNGSNAITEQLNLSSAVDKQIVPITTIDDAYHEIADGGTLKWTSATAGTFPGAECYVIGVKTA